MTLYRLLHLGKDRPFDQTPDDRARDSSRLKTIGLIVGITASVLAIIGSMIVLPDKVSVAVAKAVQVQLDDRYVQKDDYDKAHQKLEAQALKAAESARTEASGYADVIKEAVLGELRAYEHRTDDRLDKIFTQTSYVHGILKGEKQPDYVPLPRQK